LSQNASFTDAVPHVEENSANVSMIGLTGNMMAEQHNKMDTSLLDLGGYMMATDQRAETSILLGHQGHADVEQSFMSHDGDMAKPVANEFGERSVMDL